MSVKLPSATPFEADNRLILARAVRGSAAICLILFGFLAGWLWSSVGAGHLLSAHGVIWLATLLGMATDYFGIIFFRAHRFIEAALMGKSSAWTIIPEWLPILLTIGIGFLFVWSII